MLLYLSLLFALVVSNWQVPLSDETPQHVPIHFAMDREYEAVVQVEEVFSFQGKDTALTHAIYLLSDEDGAPLLYYADILTPVCIDNICKPMVIEIYWNLLGAYVGYAVDPEAPLTKYDHDLFEKEDYQKLHDLLLNRYSILERRELSDLFDTNAKPQEKVKFKGQEVDAVSGATKKEIKESVVEGALYSCYTAWHLVHGEVVQKMDAYLDSIYTRELASYFLDSDYEDYQSYALKQLNADDFEQHLARITAIFGQAKPLLRRYILKKMPEELWKDEYTTVSFFQYFAHLDINTRTLLIKELENAHPQALRLLAVGIQDMTKNQLRSYLNYLETRPDLMDSTIEEALKKTLAAKDYSYNYLIEAFLKDK